MANGSVSDDVVRVPTDKCISHNNCNEDHDVNDNVNDINNNDNIDSDSNNIFAHDVVAVTERDQSRAKA